MKTAFMSTTSTVTCGGRCKHQNGWFGTIPFWIFKRKIFSCSDCGDSLWGKRLKKFRKEDYERRGHDK